MTGAPRPCTGILPVLVALAGRQLNTEGGKDISIPPGALRGKNQGFAALVG